MPSINPITKDQMYMQAIAKNLGLDYDPGDISDVDPITKDQLFLKEIALATAGGVGGKKTYSTTEQEVGTWVDDKTIYQKTLELTGLSQVGDWTVLDTSVLYDTLISVEGVRVTAEGQSLNFMNSLDINPRFSVKTDNKLYYFSQNALTGTIYITLQYTKATI